MFQFKGSDISLCRNLSPSCALNHFVETGKIDFQIVVWLLAIKLYDYTVNCCLNINLISYELVFHFSI